MPLSEEILDKIRHLYEVASQVKKYWVKIQLWQCEEYKTSRLEIDIYTYPEEHILETFYKTEIELNKCTAEKNLQYAIDNIKELITTSTNEND